MSFQLAVASLAGLGRRTVTGMMVNCGRQFCDWSAIYRLFSRCRFNPEPFFNAARRRVGEFLGDREPLVAAIDDALLRRGGRKTPAVAYHRDPLGPPFHVNLVLGQRALQLSAALPLGTGAARMVPVDFTILPSVRKPSRKAPEAARAAHKQRKRACSLTATATERLAKLRKALDGDPGGRNRVLVVVGDGGYTNGKVLKNLPERTVFIGRVRHVSSNTSERRSGPRHSG